MDARIVDARDRCRIDLPQLLHRKHQASSKVRDAMRPCRAAAVAVNRHSPRHRRRRLGGGPRLWQKRSRGKRGRGELDSFHRGVPEWSRRLIASVPPFAPTVSALSCHHRHGSSRRSVTDRGPTRAVQRSPRYRRWRQCDRAAHTAASHRRVIDVAPHAEVMPFPPSVPEQRVGVAGNSWRKLMARLPRLYLLGRDRTSAACRKT